MLETAALAALFGCAIWIVFRPVINFILDWLAQTGRFDSDSQDLKKERLPGCRIHGAVYPEIQTGFRATCST